MLPIRRSGTTSRQVGAAGLPELNILSLGWRHNDDRSSSGTGRRSHWRPNGSLCAITTTEFSGGTGGGNSLANDQEFTDYSAYSTYLVADVTFTEPVFLTQVTTYLEILQSFGGVTMARMHLFQKFGALPDNVLDDPTSSLLVNVSYDVNTGFLTTVGLNEMVAAGDYWIGLTPIGAFGGIGQVEHFGGLNSNGDPDAYRNPGGAFNFPDGTDWGQIGNNIKFGIEQDIALTIEGSAIPAPGALALLGVAGIVTRRRRRR